MSPALRTAAAPSAPAPAEVQMPEPDGFSVLGLFTTSRSTAANFSKGADAPVCEWISPQVAIAYAAAREAAERERVRGLIEQCRDALAEELAAWDIDPPLHHVKTAHDACQEWLAAARAELGGKP